MGQWRSESQDLKTEFGNSDIDLGVCGLKVPIEAIDVDKIVQRKKVQHRD